MTSRAKSSATTPETITLDTPTFTASSSSDRTLATWAHNTIQKHVQATFKHEPDVGRDRDPEDLHKMRVGMRRLRSDRLVFDRVIVWPSSIDDRTIAKLGRTLGGLRDLDVLLACLREQYRPQIVVSEESAGNTKIQTELQRFDAAIAKLERQRKPALRQVRHLFTTKSYRRVVRRLNQWVTQPRYQALAERSVDFVIPDLVLPSIATLLLHPAWDCDPDQTLTGSNRAAVDRFFDQHGTQLHSLRKQAKRVRYLLETFADCYPASSDYHTSVDMVRQIQAVLGDFQDNCVLVEFARHYLADRAGAIALPTFDQILAQQRQTLLSDWRSLRAQFLDVGQRDRLRRSVLTGNKSPS
jgi:CHAD domain-containing protein